MVTVQLSSKEVFCFLVWLGVTSITACSRISSFHYMEEKEYELDPRVVRWEKATTNEIKNFLDQGFTPYAKLTNKAVCLEKAFHYLPGVVDLLNGPYRYGYFVNIKKNRHLRANASLVLLPKQRNKAKEVYPKGKIEIGLHDNNGRLVIHHMMFRPKENMPSLKVPYICLPEKNKLYRLNRKTEQKINKENNPGPKAPHIGLSEQNKSYQLNCKTEDKINKENLPIILEKRNMQTYFNSKENVYVIKYIPPTPSPHKLVTIFVHKTNGIAN